jgi:acyl-coenzyme A synthetase/AMP-(fatty) acid ligase
MVPIDYFDFVAERAASGIAVIDGEHQITYEQLAAISHVIGGLVSSHGNADEAVPSVLFSPNDWRVIASMLGIMRAGGAIVPLHAESTVDAAADFLNQVKARCLFFHSSLSTSVGQLRQLVPSLRTCVQLDGRSEHDLSLEDLLGRPAFPIADWIDSSGNRSRPVFYWSTSGSTGRPKVVIEDCGCFDAVLKVTCGIDRSTDRHVSLGLAPLSHGAGPAAFGTLTFGGTVVVMRTFDARDVLRKIEQHRVSEIWLSPTALYLLLDCADRTTYDLSSLRRVRLGMAGVSPERVKEAVEAFGPCINHSYGQIETSFVTMLDSQTIAAAVRGEHPERLLSSGVSIGVNRFGIMDDNDQLLPIGSSGEIVVRGACVKRYLDPSLTAEAQRSGWHRTGDVGYVDADGFLYVTGRVKDVVNISGFKISAAEVERVIRELPEIHDCAVVAAPDHIRGESAKAVVTLRPGLSISDAAILAHCRRRLGLRKAPSSVEQWTELPRSPAGKIDKQRIRAQFWKCPPVHQEVATASKS